MRVFGIVGRQDSGKTHLVERLVRELRGRRLCVSTLKHTHHHAPQLEPAHKDSARHRAAGAHEVLLASDHGWFLSRAGTGTTPPLRELLRELSPCDLVLVEGYKHEAAVPRLEVYRGGEPPLAQADPTLLAIACPATLALPTLALPRLDLDGTALVADFVLKFAIDMHADAGRVDPGA
jgi:molybdopterin-guanine dinucleotide biosynthesis protein MobB